MMRLRLQMARAVFGAALKQKEECHRVVCSWKSMNMSMGMNGLKPTEGPSMMMPGLISRRFCSYSSSDSDDEEDSDDEGDSYDEEDSDDEGDSDLAKARKRTMENLYHSSDRILVFDSNDLDFSAELVKKLGGGSNIIVTTADPEPKSGLPKVKLQNLHVMQTRVVHNIDPLNPIIPIFSEPQQEEGKAKESEGKETEGVQKRLEAKEAVAVADGEDKGGPWGEHNTRTYKFVIFVQPTFPTVTGKWDHPGTIELIKSLLKDYLTTSMNRFVSPEGGEIQVIMRAKGKHLMWNIPAVGAAIDKLIELDQLKFTWGKFFIEKGNKKKPKKGKTKDKKKIGHDHMEFCVWRFFYQPTPTEVEDQGEPGPGPEA